MTCLAAQGSFTRAHSFLITYPFTGLATTNKTPAAARRGTPKLKARAENWDKVRNKNNFLDNMELNPASTEEYFCGPAGHAFRPPPSVFHSIFFLGKKCAICDTLLISGSSLALRGDETSMINECYFCDTYVHYGCRSRCTTPCPRTVYKGAKGTSLAEAADRDSSSLAVPSLSPPPPPVSSPSSPPETKSAPVDVFGSLKEYSNALSLAMKKSAITFRRPKEDEEEVRDVCVLGSGETFHN